MKPEEFENIINEALTNEVRRTILVENEEKGGYQIMCNGEPIETFESEDDALQHLDIYKKEHPKKEFIIEKIKYNSHDEMIDEIGDMGEELNENKKTMKKTTIKVKNLAEAVFRAKNKGAKEFTLGETTYNVDECWTKLEEGWGIDEDDKPDFLDLDDDGDTEEPMKSAAKDAQEGEDCMECGSGYTMEMDETCDDCGSDDVLEGGTCETCGKEICECGQMNESKKTVLRLSENELVDLINKMVMESIPGLSVTKNSQEESKKDSDEYLKSVEKKIKDYSSFDGNDNPEFPNHIKGDVEARHNTEEEDEFVADNRGGGMEDLNYDNEPDEKFIERVRKALEGDSTMGNSQDAANVVKSDLGKKIAKKVERKKEAREEAPMYNKDVQPVKHINESVEKELSLMKSLFSYNKKTQ